MLGERCRFSHVVTTLAERPRFHIQQTCSTGSVDERGQVDEDRRERVFALSAHVFLAVLIDAQDPDARQMVRICINQRLRRVDGQVVDEVRPIPSALLIAWMLI